MRCLPRGPSGVCACLHAFVATGVPAQAPPDPTVVFRVLSCAPQNGMLILRNESIFPGMVGISLPLKGNLWVREDGTFNLSGFFRRQIPK